MSRDVFFFNDFQLTFSPLRQGAPCLSLSGVGLYDVRNGMIAKTVYRRIRSICPDRLRQGAPYLSLSGVGLYDVRKGMIAKTV